MAAAVIYPVILSGGSGQRLWPLSRRSYPKQFLRFVGDTTLFQAAVERTVGPGFAAPTVVASDEHRFVVAEQLAQRGVQPRRILIEPVARKTAFAVAVAALDIAAEAADALLLVMPSDHVIKDTEGFRAAVETARAPAAAGRLMTFGIAPERPETGYGYLEQGEDLGQGAFTLARFLEKPDSATAERLVAGGRHQWNSGIFFLPVPALLQAFERLAPEILAAARGAIEGAACDLDFSRLERAAAESAPAVSFDRAIMEKTSDAGMVPCAIGWSDVGAWDALWQISERDGEDNVLVGDVAAEDSRGCYLRSESRLVAALGVENLIVIETDTAVLVMPRERAQEVKALVKQLRRRERPEAEEHATVFRPWGWYRGIAVGERWQVKHIAVKPGASLSLQMHHHRAEHWVVVRGTARTTCGDEVRIIAENESVYISAGMRHRLENPGKIQLELIEVQTGSYLGEDDIVRFSDTYGRQ